MTDEDLCVFCLGKEHARNVLEGKICVHCRPFPPSRKEGQPSASRDSGPTAAEAWRRMKSWGSQLDVADELERDRPFSRSWDWTLSILLHCIWTSFWRLWIIKINISGHKPPAQVSLPFFIKSRCGGWEGVEKVIFYRIHRFQHTSYADTEGMRENGYEGMPPVQEMITSLSLCGETSSLKAPSWPSKPLSFA